MRKFTLPLLALAACFANGQTTVEWPLQGPPPTPGIAIVNHLPGPVRVTRLGGQFLLGPGIFRVYRPNLTSYVTFGYSFLSKRGDVINLVMDKKQIP